jgi:hypothetical protein
MIRNLKVLGLALAAVFAMSAVAASAASAGVTLTGPETGLSVDATDPAATFTTAGGTKVECHATYTVGKVDETKPEGVHPPLILPVEELTITPDYSKCKAKGSGGGELGPVTVTMNGCDFDLKLITNPANTFSATSKITCPPEKKIEIHIYRDAEHKENLCTFTVFANKNEDLSGGKAVNTAKGVTLEGSVPGVKVTRDNILCGGTVEQEATQSLGGELLAEGGENVIQLSD